MKTSREHFQRTLSSRAEKTSLLRINKLRQERKTRTTLVRRPSRDSGYCSIMCHMTSCLAMVLNCFWSAFLAIEKKQFRNLMNKILRVYSVPLNHQTICLISWRDYLTPPTFSRTLRWKSRDWRIWKNWCLDLRAYLFLLFFCTLWWIFFKLLSFRSESCRVENNFFTTFNINKQWLDISLTRMI